MSDTGERFTAVSAAVLLGVVLIGAAVLLIYFLVYNATINKSISTQGREGRHRMPAPASAGKTVAVVALAVLMISVWLDIGSIKEQIGNINVNCNTLTQQVMSLESEIYSLNEKLSKEQSIFTKVDIGYGRLDISNHSVKISVSAAPKSCTEEAELNIAFGDNVTKLSKSDAGVFSGEIEIDLYRAYDSGDALITVTDGGKIVTEEFDLDVYSIREKYGAEVRSQFDDFISCEYKSGRLDMKFNRLIRDTEEGEEFFVRDSFKLVVEAEGNVILEDSIPSSDQSSADIFSLEIEKSCEIPENTETDIYIRAKDKCGNTHICQVFSYGISYGENITTGFGTEKVYDSTGNLIAEF